MNSQLIDKRNNCYTAIFEFADYLYQLKQNNGWKIAKELSGLDLHKFQWFLAIGSFVNRTHNISPYHYIEVSGLTPTKAKNYLTMAVQQNLTPCQLRKVIRQGETKVKASKKEKCGINKFGKYFNLLQSQLKSMSQEERIRATNLLKTL